MENKSNLVDCQGFRKEDDGDNLMAPMSLGNDGSILELDGSNGCMSTKCHQVVHFKMVNYAVCLSSQYKYLGHLKNAFLIDSQFDKNLSTILEISQIDFRVLSLKCLVLNLFFCNKIY